MIKRSLKGQVGILTLVLFLYITLLLR
ncbi:hypothetical protein CYG50_05070 [Providencia huaxiensis]|nr:hypothetical protein CYG50_05070 [Providencia huaxiensis]